MKPSLVQCLKCFCVFPDPAVLVECEECGFNQVRRVEPIDAVIATLEAQLAGLSAINRVLAAELAAQHAEEFK